MKLVDDSTSLDLDIEDVGYVVPFSNIHDKIDVAKLSLTIQTIKDC